MNNDDVGCQSKDLGPGHTIFVLRGQGKPVEDLSLDLLLTSMQSWRDLYPTRSVTDLQIIRNGNVARSINVFWTERKARDLKIEVTQKVVDTYGKEYVEALLVDARDFYLKDKHPINVAVMISRREVVMVVSKRRSHCCIQTLDELLATLPVDDALTIQQAFAKYRETDDQGYCVIPCSDQLQFGVDQ